MKYMGSKNRISKHIVPLIKKYLSKNQYYIEPFVGGGNMINKIDHPLRIGSDIDEYVIEALKLIRDDPYSLPDFVSEEEYNKAKQFTNKALKGYYGYALSYGGKFFGGYRRDKKNDDSTENMAVQSKRAKNSAIKQSPKLQNVKFYCCSYDELEIPKNSIIYCDPPYMNTTKYRTDIDYNKFWQWCRKKIEEGHKLFISEYNAPEDFISIWNKEISSSLTKDTGSKKGVERLFIHQNQIDNNNLLNLFFK
jgi:DNA adenine methylase